MNDTQDARRDCQVLVVGAGPTGLVLAADLLARGISTRIIDKGDGIHLETRAIAVHARALEVLDQMGLAERFVDHGQVVRWFSFYTDGKERGGQGVPGVLRRILPAGHDWRLGGDAGAAGLRRPRHLPGT